MPKRLTKEERAERQRLYEKGLNDREIAKRMGQTPKTISRWRLNNHLKTNEDKRLTNSGQPGQLCVTCQNTSRYKCSWFDPDNPQPVEGWVATPTIKRFRSEGRIYDYESYHITECPNYIPEDVSS